MSYVLINGKRHYKDDRTGEVIIDNISQDAADRRSQQMSIPPPLPQPPLIPSVSTQAQLTHRTGPLAQLIALLHRMLLTATISVAVSSLLLIGVYFLKEPVTFRVRFHYELRNTGTIAARVEQVCERWPGLSETERGYRND